ASIMRFPFVMEVHPSVPAKTVAEFMAYTKANPGKVNMASAGTGSATHLTGELFKMMTGLNILHVPYRGSGPALIDLIGGQGNVPHCFPRNADGMRLFDGETPRLHHAARRCGGGMAARGARAAVRPGAADRCADGPCRERSRGTVPHCGVPENAARHGLD